MCYICHSCGAKIDGMYLFDHMYNKICTDCSTALDLKTMNEGDNISLMYTHDGKQAYMTNIQNTLLFPVKRFVATDKMLQVWFYYNSEVWFGERLRNHNTSNGFVFICKKI